MKLPEHSHHSLRYALTRTILLWSGLFFTLLAIIFVLTFDDVRGYTMQKVAEYRLNYQTQEFSKHLKEQDRTSIGEESDALVQDPEIAGIILIDASGELLHTAIHDDHLSLASFSEITPSTLAATIYNTPHLHLYESNIPDSNVKLFLVLDDRPITRAIHTSTFITGIVMLMLVLLSIFALHRVLRIQLIEPLEQLRVIMGTGETMPDRVIEQMEHSLPSEAGDILETYDQLVHAEHAMAQRFHDMLDRVPGCVWSASADLKYTDASARSVQVFNYPQSQLKGLELWSWLPDEQQRNTNLRQLHKAISTRAPTLEMAYCIQMGDKEQWFGENICLHYAKSAVSGENTFAGLFGISNEITQRKAEEGAIQSMQQQARKMEAVGTLVGGIAHEFNNMLAGIIGNIFLLKSEFKEGSQAAIRLARIEKLGNRAAGLIDQLLAFGRRNRISIRDIDLVPLLQQVHAIESAGLPPHIKLSLDISKLAADESIAVRADSSLLRQVLASLISNATDACRQKSAAEINIAVRDVESNAAFISRFPQLHGKHVLCVCVSDTGSGIQSDLLSRVFDPFFTTKEVGQGTGMGLSMVYGLMEGFGGAVELKSEEGAGTTVHLYLQQSDSISDNEGQTEPPVILHYGQGETILIADDEHLVREAASDVLLKLNYKPVAVENGEAALHHIEGHTAEVDLVLLDLIMPVMGGAEAAGKIRHIKPDLPIVFVTGYNLSDIDYKDLQLSKTQIVTKPYQVAHLSQIIASLLHPEMKPDDVQAVRATKPGAADSEST